MGNSKKGTPFPLLQQHERFRFWQCQPYFCTHPDLALRLLLGFYWLQWRCSHSPLVKWSKMSQEGTILIPFTGGGQRGGKKGATVNVITDLELKVFLQSWTMFAGLCLSSWAEADVEGELLWTAVSSFARGTWWSSWICGWTGGRSGQPCLGLDAKRQNHSGRLHWLLVWNPNASFFLCGRFYRVLPVDTGQDQYKTLFRCEVFRTRSFYCNVGELLGLSWESPLEANSWLSQVCMKSVLCNVFERVQDVQWKPVHFALCYCLLN